MAYTGRYGDIDYGRWAKGSILFGAALFLAGGLGEFTISVAAAEVPGWTHALLLDLEILGVLVALLLPLLFGIVLPLTE